MPTIQTVAIVANPIAGQGKGRATAQRVCEAVEAAGMKTTAIFDLLNADLDQLISADAIVAIGGDGTLRAVAGRCLDGGGKIPALLPVPMGTANLMGRHLGIHWKTADLGPRIVQSLQRGTISMLDAAEANGQLFILMAGVGIDGLIVHELDRMRRGPISFASYVLPAALAIATYRYPPLQVVADDEEIFASAPAIALVANISEYGTGFPLAPHARPDDGMLDICVVPVESPVDALHKFLHAAAGELLSIEGVVYTRAKQIEIRSPKQVPIQIDGDPAGHTPARINLLPIRLPFIVPA
ncbi:MAG: diacylglycerol kinase family protein [Tepidisphaeraceae bacterium]|jgi:YegS/Rv2252/BmrU family lipid kinase